MRYRFVGEEPAFVPDLHLELQPGQEFESHLAFSPGSFELLEDVPPLKAEAESEVGV